MTQPIRDVMVANLLDHPSASMPGLIEFGSEVPDDVTDAYAIVDRIIADERLTVALSTPPADNVRPWRPEDGDTRCQQCGQPNPIWWADNAQWNVTIGGPDATDDPGGVLCPTCYHAKWLGREDGVSTPPADDVREALDFLDALNESGRIQYDDYVALHGLVSVIETDSSAVPTEVQEIPVFAGTLDALDALTVRPEVRPHGTVTDAEVEAAALTWSGAPFPSKASLTKARAALEAAREVHP